MIGNAQIGRSGYDEYGANDDDMYTEYGGV
jgi:hypothetical protein